MSTSKKEKKVRPENFGIALDAAVLPILDQLVEDQKTNKKQLVSTLIRWFDSLGKTERALILDQVSGVDAGLVALIVLHRTDPEFADWGQYVQRLLRKPGATPGAAAS